MESTSNSSLTPSHIRIDSQSSARRGDTSPHTRSLSSPSNREKREILSKAPSSFSKSTSNLTPRIENVAKSLIPSDNSLNPPKITRTFTNEKTQSTSSSEKTSRNSDESSIVSLTAEEASITSLKPIPLSPQPYTPPRLSLSSTPALMPHLETTESFAQMAYKDESKFLELRLLEIPRINVPPEKEKKFDNQIAAKILDDVKHIRNQWPSYPKVSELEKNCNDLFLKALRSNLTSQVEDCANATFRKMYASKKEFCLKALKVVQSNAKLLEHFIPRLEAVARTMLDLCTKQEKMSNWCSKTIKCLNSFKLLYGRGENIPYLLQKFFGNFKEALSTDAKMKEILEAVFKEEGFSNLYVFLKFWNNPNTVYKKYQDHILPLLDNIINEKSTLTKLTVYNQRHTWIEPEDAPNMIKKIGAFEIARIFMQESRVLFESIKINQTTLDTVNDCLSSPPNPSKTKPFLGIQIAFYRKLFSEIYEKLGITQHPDKINNDILIILLIHEFLQELAIKVVPAMPRDNPTKELTDSKKAQKKSEKDVKKSETKAPKTSEEKAVIELNYLRKDIISTHIPIFHGVNVASLINWESVKAKTDSIKVEDIERTILNTIPLINILRLCTNRVWGKCYLVLLKLYPSLFQVSPTKSNRVQSVLSQGIDLEIDIKKDKTNYAVTQIKSYDVFKKLNEDPTNHDIDRTKKIATLTFKWTVSPHSQSWKGVIQVSKIDIINGVDDESRALQAIMMENLNQYQLLDPYRTSVTSEEWVTPY